MSTAILVLAAGSSSRMAPRDKLTEVVDQIPLLRRQTKAACATGHPVFVTLPNGNPARTAALKDLDVTIVYVNNSSQGMSASIATGAAAMPSEMSNLVVLPADMPDITTDDLLAVINASQSSPDQICQGHTAAGQPGHPVAFPKRLFGQLRALQGDRGAKSLLLAEDVKAVPLPFDHAITDLDTPEDWEAWRRNRNRP